ncbi:hypothetical protein [Deinococcus gobiensis]|uniref:Uncharacterized protein n=1 Tax=Deinococcus gobiensis (strain DSM 21396 / JCM 16679 / CGMCC 1.7299 / I-0) TaxID=745776 RepID=H8H2U0_DEIGI|nr:hypothetical protein [Deinococcus gobiensis]AFD27837.1 hypothetical protein DGo_PC0045 [Deinococcus gobiensis I-0]
MLDERTKAASLATLQQDGLDEYEDARILPRRMGITSIQEAKKQAIPMTPKELRLIFSREPAVRAVTTPELLPTGTETRF